MSALAQNVSISGKVISAEDKQGLAGVTVNIKGTSTATTTDFEGNYKIEAPQGSILVFSYVGFKSQEIPVGTSTTIDVILESDTKLEEVVVVGYTTVQKKDVTGAITSLTPKDFNQGPITSPLQQLNGRAAGVAINQVGSEPGVNPTIRIRGITSLIGGNDPLVVIDGVQGNLGLLNQLPPNEILSIDILKDASATAIYGSRGAAGVIVVTTKKGSPDQTSLEYSGVLSVESIAKKYDMLSANEYRALAEKRGITGFDLGGNTDWFKEISRTGYTQNHNLAFSSGSKNFNYRASITGIFQEGVIIKSNSENYIGRIQATQKAIDNRLTLTYNLNMNVLNRNYNAGAIGGAISTRPTNPIFNPDGTYFIDNTLFNYTNPVARAREIYDNERFNNFFSSVRAEYEILDGLTATLFGSWRKENREYGSYKSRITDFEGRQNNGVARRSTNLANERLLNLILNYNKNIGDHSFGITGVYEWQKQIYEGQNTLGINFPNDLLGVNAIQNAGSFSLPGDQTVYPNSYKNDRTLVSFLARANYAFKGKYQATVSFRRDGASVFGANNKWANFPSFSLAWSATEEDFIKNLGIFDNLKIRAGFGVTGNQQGLGPLNSVLLAGNAGNTFFAGQLIRNFAITQNANPNLRWETREMYNAGIDFTILKNKLSGTIDYFYGTTKDLLFGYQVPVPPFPFGSITANVGSVLNQGIELTLNYNLINTDDLSVNLGGNFTSIRTTVTELSGSLPDGTPLKTDYVGWGGVDLIGVGGQNNDMSYLIKGKPLGTFYLFKHIGVDDNGNQLVDDVNGNGKIDQGRLSEDRFIAGQVLPKFTYAFTPSARYKDFDINIVLRGAYGHKIYNARRAQLSLLNRVGQSNVLAGAADIGMVNVNDASATDYWLEDGGFTRLENLTIGYNVKTSGWKYVSNLRVSFTTNNLFVITRYKGIDPEINVSGGGGSGIDTGIYPRTRAFALGLNVTFK
ncbi:MAG: TonB-dependent receptor [Bacteroidia bacterium]|nr:TonB-dependent receptor [Bacteroidia bacterium]MDW8300855.1 TonB-dependent receptor [Bacteroidia bacterium]